jgi:hypothetical protein
VPVGPFSRYRDLELLVVRHATRGDTRSLPIRRRQLPPEPPARLHRFGGYETADLLARRYFGREDLYWRLLDANGGRLPDSFVAGELLTVPPLATATAVERPG